MPSLFFLENRNDWFPSTRSLRGALNANRAISSGMRMKESSDLWTCWYYGNRIRIHMATTAAGTIEEVSRLAGEAARVTPAVRARRGTGQAQTPGRVLVGAPGTMPVTLVSETGKNKKQQNTAFDPSSSIFKFNIDFLSRDRAQSVRV